MLVGDGAAPVAHGSVLVVRTAASGDRQAVHKPDDHLIGVDVLEHQVGFAVVVVVGDCLYLPALCRDLGGEALRAGAAGDVAARMRNECG